MMRLTVNRAGPVNLQYDTGNFNDVLDGK